MAVTEIKEFKEEELEELARFLYENGFNHPELGNKELLRWTSGFRFISRSRGEIVGYIAQIPHIYIYGIRSGKTDIEKIGWSVTLVLKDFGDTPDAARRRTAYTNELLLKVENNPPWQFAAVGVVPDIEEFYKIRGHIVRRDCLKMYARFIKPRKMLSYLNKSTLLTLPIRAANVYFRVRKIGQTGTIDKISRFNPDWDDRWDSLLSQCYELYGSRNAEYLNYKLSQPNKNYHVYVHSDSGYIVFREARHFAKDLYIVKICDLVGTENARLDLMQIAFNHAYEVKAYGIVAVGSNYDERLFKKAGLYISKPYVVTLPRTITSKIHVTFFDADLDNLW